MSDLAAVSVDSAATALQSPFHVVALRRDAEDERSSACAYFSTLKLKVPRKLI